MFQYDFDAATAINFLRTYDLMDVFKLNLEGNHANLAGHTYQHEIRTAREAGVLGSLDANQGDKLIGWDMDEFPNDLYETSTVMWEVLAEADRPSRRSELRRQAAPYLLHRRGSVPFPHRRHGFLRRRPPGCRQDA